MVEFNSEENRLNLNIKDSYYNNLDVESFALMLKDPSYCYKFYWLEAIVKLISEGIRETTFNDIIDEMISNAWYSVREFHIHLSGYQANEVRDGLERAVNALANVSDLTANASKTEIKNAIKENEIELKPYKVQLTNMVPYRALAGFFNKFDEKVNWDSQKRLVEYIRRVDNNISLPYVLGENSKLKREVIFNIDWMNLIQDNTVAILGWIQFEKTKWLQMNNPEVPGLVYKLAPLDEKMRKLNKVKNLWEKFLEIEDIYDVFSGKIIEHNKYDIDHFIPWSFVMNDELWNLMPIDSSLNSAKSNKLPKWDPFFRNFACNQFKLYNTVNTNNIIRQVFENCYRDNLHSLWASQELYIPGNNEEQFFNILARNMYPVYESAKRQGYEIWNY